jgi:hypothetical protein
MPARLMLNYLTHALLPPPFLALVIFQKGSCVFCLGLALDYVFSTSASCIARIAHMHHYA